MDQVLEQIRHLACSMNLVVLYQEATPEQGHVLSLYYGKTCLHRTSDLSTAEHYLWGYRDGRSNPLPEIQEALALVRNVDINLAETQTVVARMRSRLDDTEQRLEPFTRERG